MRAFHRLLWDEPNQGIARVAAYEVDRFDPTRLWDAQRMTDDIPASVRLLVAAGTLPDVMSNPLSWPIWSNRFIDIVGHLASSDLEVFEAPLFSVDTGEQIPGYRLVNIIRLVRCLDRSCSTITYDDDDPDRIAGVSRICIDGSRVGADTHIFRIAEWPFPVIFSEEAATACVGQRLRGLAFERCVMAT